MSAVPFAAHVAGFAAGIAPQCADASEAILTSLVDTVGCMAGGANAAPVAIARAYAEATARLDPAGPSRAASIAGSPAHFTLEAAVFANALAARYLDYNDIYLSMEAVHPSDNIPIALALAEAFQRSGAELIEAVGLGYEVHCRLADTVSTRRGGWDNVILGAIVGSVMAGSLLRLTEAQQAHAINIAATGNTALMATRAGALSMWKGAACAYAARAGLFAALVAAQGMTGPARALDGKYGLFAQVTGEADPSGFASDGAALRLTGVHLKAYPSQYFTQTAVDAALALRARVPADAIARVVVDTFEFGRVASADSPQKWCPESRETADHSMPYVVAAALLDGAVGEAQFADERIAAPDIRALMARIEVREDPAFTKAYPDRVTTRIAVETRDGEGAVETVHYPRGHTRNPMTRAEVSDKFRDLWPGWGKEVLEVLWGLGRLDGPTLSTVLRRTVGGAGDRLA